ncbi:hypothetical protein [Desertivirga brevis]|uniref:hypothetical protein n=1 Tax=Desertivirga brevis TaxID=2810310 RepID=UPI001A979A08|nr:hypothetical protein [Pedobacter sp. SYSU D00873]
MKRVTKRLVGVAMVFALFAGTKAFAQKGGANYTWNVNKPVQSGSVIRSATGAHTAKGTGTHLGTNHIPSTNFSKVILNRSAAGTNFAKGTGTHLGTTWIASTNRVPGNVIRSATGIHTAQGTGTTLGTTAIPAGSIVNPRSFNSEYSLAANK